MACLLTVFMAHAQAPGEIDVTFGTQGRVVIDVDEFDRTIEVASHAFDRSIVLAQTGHWDGPDFDMDFSLVALLPDGSLDPSFGNGGIVTSDFDTFSYADPRAMVLQPDGKIVILGEGRPIGVNEGAWCVRRFMPDGTPDSSFAVNGTKTFLMMGADESPRSLALRTDGRIIAAGATFDSVGIHNEYPAVICLMPNGDFDTSFGTTGKIAVDFGLGVIDVNLTGNNVNRHTNGGFVEAVIAQPDGKVLCGGSFYNGIAYQCMFFRLNADGTADPGFGTGGILFVDLSPGFKNLVRRAVLQPDTSSLYVVTVGGTFGDSEMYTVEIGEAGQLGNLQTWDLGGNYDFSHAIWLADHGRPVVVGGSVHPSQYNNGVTIENFSAVRLEENGGWSMDGTFGQSGWDTLRITPGLGAAATAVTDLSNARLLLAGHQETNDTVNTQDLALLVIYNTLSNSVGEAPDANALPAYPNPTTGLLKLPYQGTMGTLIQVYDVSGQLQLERYRDTHIMTIDLSPFPNGLYLIRESGVAPYRVVKH